MARGRKAKDWEIDQIKRERAEAMRRQVSGECKACNRYKKDCNGLVMWHYMFCPDIEDKTAHRQEEAERFKELIAQRDKKK